MPLERNSDGTLVNFDLGTVKGTYISFVRHLNLEKGTTQVWVVYTSDLRTPLGTVKWFGRWWKYSFFPEAKTVFENTCMSEIMELSTELMNLWRLAKKGKDAA